MSPHSSSSSSSSRADYQSDSSSIVYQHEPFVTFCSRVLNLALGLWPESVPDDFSVERLPGGGFNRIIGLTRRGTHRSSTIDTQYVVRIPRFDAARVDYEIAILQFLRRYTAISAPKVVTFDVARHNALDSPYTIQNRIAGVDLYSSFPSLNHDTISNDAESPANLAAYFIRSDSPELVSRYNDDPAAPSESTHQLLTTIFPARKADQLKRCPSDTTGPRLWDRFCRMTGELDADGWLADPRYSIAHLDFAPRNILVDLSADTTRPIISGILDWDSAVLAPRFMSCSPPLWIWAWQDDEDEDERTANDDPPDPEARQLKAQFESAAGSDYVRLAYGPPYRLARRLVRFAVDGVRSNEDYKEAEVMLQEWANFHASTTRS